MAGRCILIDVLSFLLLIDSCFYFCGSPQSLPLADPRRSSNRHRRIRCPIPGAPLLLPADRPCGGTGRSHRKRRPLSHRLGQDAPSVQSQGLPVREGRPLDDAPLQARPPAGLPGHWSGGTGSDPLVGFVLWCLRVLQGGAQPVGLETPGTKRNGRARPPHAARGPRPGGRQRQRPVLLCVCAQGGHQATAPDPCNRRRRRLSRDWQHRPREGTLRTVRRVRGDPVAEHSVGDDSLCAVRGTQAQVGVWRRSRHRERHRERPPPVRRDLSGGGRRRIDVQFRHDTHRRRQDAHGDRELSPRCPIVHAARRPGRGMEGALRGGRIAGPLERGLFGNWLWNL
mmetsp:Transcript_14926/g.41534  ORF Transcript_14926/g.41534 Transcript_14926/m.41534 type:complete len:340 (+) Transcript_14926:522-1541(+)